MSDRHNWFPHHKPNHTAKIRLFCLPYAGGRAAAFYSWAKLLPPDIDVFPVELPGHGFRVGERPFTRISALVQELTNAIQPYLDLPIALFGHSLGSVIGFELAHALWSEYQISPSHLLISACRAPQSPKNLTVTYDQPDDEFLRNIRRLDGTPQEIFQEPEIVAFILPILRADFEMYNTYNYMPRPSLPCPITVFGGLQDKSTPQEYLAGWQEHTSGNFVRHMFPGGHFFLNTAEPVLLSLIARTLV
jgi:surfactin synthase thioesterase subunit